VTNALDRMAWAHAARIEDPTIWRTLVVLTDMTNDAGICWPKLELLCERVMRSERTVRNALDALVDDGYLERHRRRTAGKLRGYLFRICAPGLQPVTEDDCPMWLTEGEFSDLPNHWLSSSTGNGLPVATGNGLPVDQRQPVAGQELTHRSEPPRSEEVPSSTVVDQPVLELVGEQPDDGFDTAWSVYPRRNGRKAGSKAKARQRWKALTRTQRLQVRTAIDNYARERAPSGNGQYVMDFARFLGSEWETWVEPATSSPPTPQRTLTALEQVLGEGWA